MKYEKINFLLNLIKKGVLYLCKTKIPSVILCHVFLEHVCVGIIQIILALV